VVKEKQRLALNIQRSTSNYFGARDAPIFQSVDRPAAGPGEFRMSDWNGKSGCALKHWKQGNAEN